jgi:hypothetical protein
VRGRRLEQDGGTGQIGQEAVGVKVRREVAVAVEYVDPVVEDAHLGLPSPDDKLVGVEERGPVGWRRKLTQEVGAGVVDQEERHALCVVGAARRASSHGEIGLGHDDGRAVARVGEGSVGTS